MSTTDLLKILPATFAEIGPKVYLGKAACEVKAALEVLMAEGAIVFRDGKYRATKPSPRELITEPRVPVEPKPATGGIVEVHDRGVIGDKQSQSIYLASGDSNPLGDAEGRRYVSRCEASSPSQRLAEDPVAFKESPFYKAVEELSSTPEQKERRLIYQVKTEFDLQDEVCTPTFIRRQIESLQLFDKKQMDYGPENIAGDGAEGVRVRLGDKIARLRTLMASGRNPENESLEDTWLDIANYGLIGLMCHRGEWPGVPAYKATSSKELLKDLLLRLQAEGSDILEILEPVYTEVHGEERELNLRLVSDES